MGVFVLGSRFRSLIVGGSHIPKEVPIYRGPIPLPYVLATVSDTSNIPQNDVGH